MRPWYSVPNVETLGYCHRSLRDDTCLRESPVPPGRFMPVRGRREILATLDSLVRPERPGKTKADTKGKGGTHIWVRYQEVGLEGRRLEAPAQE